MKHFIKSLVHRAGLVPLLRRTVPGKFRGCRVINFHRILLADEGHNYAALMGDPTVEQLDMLLGSLTRHFHFISLHECLSMWEQGHEVPPYSIMLTFDDGYASVYDHLPALLEKWSVPATVFVSTGALSGHSLWFQRLFSAIMRTSLNATPAAMTPSPIALATLDQRIAGVKKLVRIQETVSATRWEATVNEWCDALEWDGTILASERIMTWEECERLARSEWITLGGHTVSHPKLSQCDSMQAHDEIVDSARALRSRLGLQSTPFAYPGGSWSPALAEYITEAGHSCAFLMTAGLNTRATPRFELLRQYVSTEPASI